MDDNAANSLISQALVRHTPQAAVEHQLCLDLGENGMNERSCRDAGDSTFRSGVVINFDLNALNTRTVPQHARSNFSFQLTFYLAPPSSSMLMLS